VVPGPRGGYRHGMRAGTPNIGPRQRRHRLLTGAVALLVATAAATVLAAVGASTIVRALVVLPLLYFAALGFFQHREKT